ncbi:helix-turn-helix transcriptional regulator [Taibaiella lutea]|uniref:Helix-turn-helix transcriptional regulator n=1 Tax=Taibaiella lutea TaxID=2608001 RepID=A0A5M6CEA9_9BACT|nr:helix-turn-helix transcriptional regulator [Taibaiella lutea]KAA5533431.1 helix-turn-helix transcriptional regulator [Taibaiella lutea]
MYQFDLKRFRKEKRLTQDGLGAMVGYSRASLSNFESGRQPITDSFLDKLNEVFGIDVEEYKSYNRISIVNEDEDEEYTKTYWKTKYYNLLEKYNACLEEKDTLSRKLLNESKQKE